MYKQQGGNDASYSHGDGTKHRYVQDAYVNMAAMCSSQARQLAARDLSRLSPHTDQVYMDSLSDYGNCLYEMADLLSEYPRVGEHTPADKFKHSGLDKEEVLSKFTLEQVFMLLQVSSGVMLFTSLSVRVSLRVSFIR